MTRRHRRPPADVVLTQPVPFDDSTDLPDSQEGITLPEGVPPLSALPALPFVAGAPRRLPSIVKKRGLGRRAQAEQQRLQIVKASIRKDPRMAWRPFNTSELQRAIRAKNERRKLLFNTLAVPFSRRARFCIMRKVRRQVLFATKRSGRNGGKVYKRNYLSSYSCG